VLLALATALSGPLLAQQAAQPLPTFAELEAAGATIGQIHIAARDIFDTDDPKENKLLFRWANTLHIDTRPEVIQRALLFKSGDPVSVRVIDETERVLRSSRYLYDVRFRPLAVHDGVVDIEVETRDTWTLDPGFTASRTGGANSSTVDIREYNLLGTGIAVRFGRTTNVDRTSNEFSIANERAFGGWTSLSYNLSDNSDGKRQSVSVAHPFYALDTRWAAGMSASKDNRIDAIYNGGEIASQFRHRQNAAEVFGGWSRGLVDGWVQRYSIGLNDLEDYYAPEPGLVAPADLPPDQKLVGPFFRYELVEDRFEKVRNRNQIERPEFFALGLASTVQLGRASTALGSTQNAWLYAGSISRGFEPLTGDTLVASAALSGQYAQGRVQRQQVGARAEYYLPQNKHWLFYASAAGDRLTHPGPADELLLGGDNGMRGYPLRYQSGDRRALFTFEERAYTDLYLFQLFRIGGAAFIDTGRAWGGDNVNTTKPGWLSSAGFGLRIFSVRSAFGNVLHIDLAFPLDPDTQVKSPQLRVKTKTSF
jgi:Omp85 superfamily domain